MAYSKRHFFLLSFFVCVGAGIGVYTWQGAKTSSADSAAEKSSHTHKHGHKHDDNTPLSVSVQTSRQVDFPIYLNALGTVTPLRNVIVRPRVSGEIMAVSFVEGQQVKQGELLAQIDPRPLQIQLQQAQGQLTRDMALLENAKIDNARYQTLLAQDSIAAQQTATQAAQVKQYQGIVEMDEAQVSNAKLQLSYTKVLAPISGRVGLRQIDQGNLVQANETNLVTITQHQPINVIFTLPEDQIPAVQRQQNRGVPLDVVAYDRTEQKVLAEGQLIAIDNQIDVTTGTLKFKAQFDNVDETLFSNQFVNIKMHLETRKQVIDLATAAIQHDGQGAFVYVVTPENRIQLRRIKLGEQREDRVIVVENLSAGEYVVLEGFDSLREGSQVRITQKDGEAMAMPSNALSSENEKTSHL